MHRIVACVMVITKHWDWKLHSISLSDSSTTSYFTSRLVCRSAHRHQLIIPSHWFLSRNIPHRLFLLLWRVPPSKDAGSVYGFVMHSQAATNSCPPGRG